MDSVIGWVLSAVVGIIMSASVYQWGMNQQHIAQENYLAEQEAQSVIKTWLRVDALNQTLNLYNASSNQSQIFYPDCSTSNTVLPTTPCSAPDPMGFDHVVSSHVQVTGTQPYRFLVLVPTLNTANQSIYQSAMTNAGLNTALDVERFSQKVSIDMERDIRTLYRKSLLQSRPTALMLNDIGNQITVPDAMKTLVPEGSTDSSWSSFIAQGGSATGWTSVLLLPNTESLWSAVTPLADPSSTHNQFTFALGMMPVGTTLASAPPLVTQLAAQAMTWGFAVDGFDHQASDDAGLTGTTTFTASHEGMSPFHDAAAMGLYNTSAPSVQDTCGNSGTFDLGSADFIVSQSNDLMPVAGGTGLGSGSGSCVNASYINSQTPQTLTLAQNSTVSHPSTTPLAFDGTVTLPAGWTSLNPPFASTGNAPVEIPPYADYMHVNQDQNGQPATGIGSIVGSSSKYPALRFLVYVRPDSKGCDPSKSSTSPQGLQTFQNGACSYDFFYDTQPVALNQSGQYVPGNGTIYAVVSLTNTMGTIQTTSFNQEISCVPTGTQTSGVPNCNEQSGDLLGGTVSVTASANFLGATPAGGATTCSLSVNQAPYSNSCFIDCTHDVQSGAGLNNTVNGTQTTYQCLVSMTYNPVNQPSATNQSKPAKPCNNSAWSTSFLPRAGNSVDYSGYSFSTCCSIKGSNWYIGDGVIISMQCTNTLNGAGTSPMIHLQASTYDAGNHFTPGSPSYGWGLQDFYFPADLTQIAKNNATLKTWSPYPSATTWGWSTGGQKVLYLGDTVIWSVKAPPYPAATSFTLSIYIFPSSSGCGSSSCTYDVAWENVQSNAFTTDNAPPSYDGGTINGVYINGDVLPGVNTSNASKSFSSINATTTLGTPFVNKYAGLFNNPAPTVSPNPNPNPISGKNSCNNTLMSSSCFVDSSYDNTRNYSYYDLFLSTAQAKVLFGGMKPSQLPPLPFATLTVPFNGQIASNNAIICNACGNLHQWTDEPMRNQNGVF